MERFKGYKLLYIEDDRELQSIVSSFLKELFGEVLVACDAKEGLELYEKFSPDIIITDIKMPGTNGLEFCKRVRKRDGKTPIIVMSAYSDREYLLQAVELNLIKYLIKPVDEKSLFEAIELAIKREDADEKTAVKLKEGFRYDTLNRVLFKGDKIISLSASQIRFLELLIKNRDRVVSYEQIAGEMGEDGMVSLDAIRCIVRDIRKATSKDLIKNISKIGYKVGLDER
jgi:DNA-binding response OmpR family regulator